MRRFKEILTLKNWENVRCEINSTVLITMHLAVHNSVIYRAVQCSVQFDNVTSIELTIGDIQMVLCLVQYNKTCTMHYNTMSSTVQCTMQCALQCKMQYSMMYTTVCSILQVAVQSNISA